MGVLFVTHNLGVVAEIAERVVVMYAGWIVETGTVDQVFRRARHPYTIGLLSCVPELGRASELKRAGGRLASIPGTVPGIAARPPGCPFANRCRLAIDACRAAVPPLAETGGGHLSRCIRWGEL
jgi:peptide/nickel transport system ATP-binding protein